MVRIAILVFGAMAVIVLLGLARSSFDTEYCTNLMYDRSAIGSTSDGGSCVLAFENGTIESFSPSVWARQSRNLAIGLTVCLLAYGVLTRRRSDEG
ncbi:hypothetical protein [Actinospongicola halichondriae]|uniref:hypothetical protein n=1 Tax=Actinospongicola halichondriae TaxID=3236844 RepID=UPI003D5A635E